VSKSDLEKRIIKILGHRLVIEVCLRRASLVIVTFGRLHGCPDLVNAASSRKLQAIIVTRVEEVVKYRETIACDTRKESRRRWGAKA